jgi:hypothetical protein
MHNELNFCLT